MKNLDHEDKINCQRQMNVGDDYDLLLHQRLCVGGRRTNNGMACPHPDCGSNNPDSECLRPVKGGAAILPEYTPPRWRLPGLSERPKTDPARPSGRNKAGLSEDQVARIKHMRWVEGMKVAAIAQELGLNRQTIYDRMGQDPRGEKC